MLTGSAAKHTVAAQESPTGKRKKFSAASRRKMAEAQRLRWAKLKGGTQPAKPAAVAAPKPKRKLSASGRTAIIAATKKMWARKRAAAKA
jgi:hypothetical protein